MLHCSNVGAGMSSKVVTVAQQKGGAGKTTLAANLAVAFAQRGEAVALLDTDPQGSLGRWFMTRREAGEPGMEFSTASAWGVSYEIEKLKKSSDLIFLDTPPKVDSDLKPALRASDLIIVPVTASHVDLWATSDILDLAARESADVLVVLNRAKAGTRVTAEVEKALEGIGAARATTVLGHRVAYAETLGLGKAVLERGKGAWTTEMTALANEVSAALGI